MYSLLRSLVKTAVAARPASPVPCGESNTSTRVLEYLSSDLSYQTFVAAPEAEQLLNGYGNDPLQIQS